MVDVSKFLESERQAYERDPEKYKKERAEDARKAYKNYERFTDSELMNRYERMQNYKESKGGSGSRGGGGGGLKPDTDITASRKLPKMKSGGKVKVSSASKRADGCAVKGKTRGKFV
jgi:hypothetical protein